MILYEQIPDDVHAHIEKVAQALYSDSNVIFAYLFGGLAKGSIVDKEPYIRHIYESVTLRKYYDFSIKEKEIL